jgi:hypothetical protein
VRGSADDGSRPRTRPEPQLPGWPTMNPEPDVTVRDYRFTCCSCGYDLRGAPWVHDQRHVRCPECGQISLDVVALKRLSVDHVVLKRRAAEHWWCCECGRALAGPQSLRVKPGSGVIACPECQHLHIELTGIYLNDRACKRNVKCKHCGHDLFGVMALPASKAVRCTACGCWNPHVYSDVPLQQVPDHSGRPEQG